MRPAKKPICVLSGDQKGRDTPFPLSIWRGTAESSERTHNWFSLDTPAPTTKVTIRPFGDNARLLESGFRTMPAGGITDSRVVSAITGAAGLRIHPS